MSDFLPTSVWGDVLYTEMTESEQTFYEDGYDEGFELGYRQGLVDAAGAVTALFVAEVDEENADG